MQMPFHKHIKEKEKQTQTQNYSTDQNVQRTPLQQPMQVGKHVIITDPAKRLQCTQPTTYSDMPNHHHTLDIHIKTHIHSRFSPKCTRINIKNPHTEAKPHKAQAVYVQQ